ncbi:hypothetical protein ACROYT_G009200 [Oculina patagonica]
MKNTCIVFLLLLFAACSTARFVFPRRINEAMMDNTEIDVEYRRDCANVMSSIFCSRIVKIHVAFVADLQYRRLKACRLIQVQQIRTFLVGFHLSDWYLCCRSGLYQLAQC